MYQRLCRGPPLRFGRLLGSILSGYKPRMAKAHGDTQHLALRHQTWWVRLRTPQDVLKLHPGEPAFRWANLRTHSTNSLPEARRLRHAAIAAEHARWAPLRQNRPPTAAEIDSLALSEAHRYHDELASKLMDVADDLPALEHAASLEALMSYSDEATEVIRRAGYQATDDAVNALAPSSAGGAQWLLGRSTTAVSCRKCPGCGHFQLRP